MFKKSQNIPQKKLNVLRRLGLFEQSRAIVEHEHER
jgi:hypothetical protein